MKGAGLTLSPTIHQNLWPLLSAPNSANNSNPSAAHAHLVLSKEVLVAGRWKLLVSQPHFKSQNNGWKSKDGKWRSPNASETVSCMAQDAAPADSFLPVPGKGSKGPCLFDLRAGAWIGG